MRCTGTDPQTRLACVVCDLGFGDRCCWSCGTRLTSDLALVSQAIPVLERPPFESCPNCHRVCKLEELIRKSSCPGCGVTCAYEDRRNDFLINLGPDGAARSHVGIGTPKKSGINEDYVIVARRSVLGMTVSWLVLADGVSKSPDADQASKVACEAASRKIEELLTRGLPGAGTDLAEVPGTLPDPKTILKHAFAAAQAAVVALDNDRGVARPMCTIVIALIFDGKPYFCSAGDSHLYGLFSKDGRVVAKLLTTDDSSSSGGLTQCLGVPSVAPNFGELSPETIPYFIGLVAATDGAYSMFDPGPDPQTKKPRPPQGLIDAYNQCSGDARRLVNALVMDAYDGTAQDNNTAAALFLQPQARGA